MKVHIQKLSYRLDGEKGNGMECYMCPKKRDCSESDCYYNYYPEPPKELMEDEHLMKNLDRWERER